MLNSLSLPRDENAEFSFYDLIFDLLYFFLFISKGLPFTAVLCAGLFFAGQLATFKPRFFHYLGACFAGYFGGSMSYRSVVQQRLIESPSNSPFVNAIRKRRGITVEGLFLE